MTKIPTNNILFYPTPSSLIDISCHRTKCERGCDIPVVDQNFRTKKKTIFFIETSCLGGLKTKLACSVESAATANPNWYILVLFAGPLKPTFKNSKTYKALLRIPNVYFYKIDTEAFAKGTPLEDIFTTNFLKKSLYPVGHASDFMKLLVMYKFGGVYLDLDVVVMNSFDSLPSNFIALQDVDDTASGILAVAKDDVGRNFIDLTMRDLAENFTLTGWNGNANDVYSRTLEKMCNISKFSQNDICQGFHIMPHDLFYPIKYEDWILYYVSSNDEDYNIDASTAYMHHTWNAYGTRINLRSNTLLGRLYERYCPTIYDLLTENKKLK
ncbi:hypothetical protein O0L34_g2365 [Tuta absoluta]|nr:hypothetical protein O0L34_g2365 [Tuta absoluta]